MLLERLPLLGYSVGVLVVGGVHQGNEHSVKDDNNAVAAKALVYTSFSAADQSSVDLLS